MFKSWSYENVMISVSPSTDFASSSTTAMVSETSTTPQSPSDNSSGTSHNEDNTSNTASPDDLPNDMIDQQSADSNQFHDSSNPIEIDTNTSYDTSIDDGIVDNKLIDEAGEQKVKQSALENICFKDVQVEFFYK